MQITTSMAQKLVNNYKNNHWKTLNTYCASLKQNNAPNAQDSRCVWFSLDDLQQFITQIAGQNADGIRIYFGEYSQDVINEMNNDDELAGCIPNVELYNGLATVVLIPTTDIDGVSTDFNPAAQDYSNPDDLSAFNHGSLVPPPFNVSGSQLNAGLDFMVFCDQNP